MSISLFGPRNESIKILLKIFRIYLLTNIYRFPKIKRWVTYQKSKKGEPIFAPFPLTTHAKFDNFSLKYLLGDPHIFFQILNENISKTLISKFESFFTE